MKRILCILLLLCACTAQSNIPTENTSAEVTTSQATTTQATTTLTTTTTLPVFEFPEGEIQFGDLFPENIQTIALEYRCMRITLKSHKAKNDFLSYISGIPLYSEWNNENREIFFYDIDLEISGDYTIVFTENSETITAKINRAEREYAYFPLNRDKNSNKIFDALYTYVASIFDPYLILLDEKENRNIDSDFLQVLYYEDDDIIIESDFGETYWTYINAYLKDFDFNPEKYNLTINEDDIAYESLPSSVGTHIVVLKNDSISYQLKYICE